MADEPPPADGDLISVDRLRRAAEYAASSTRGTIWMRLMPEGVQIDGFAGPQGPFAHRRTVSWADFAQDGALKGAIDAASADLAAKRRG